MLDQVGTDSLVLQCSDDLLAPPEVGSYVHRHLAHSTLVQLQATGHCPHVSAPEDTAQAILNYLSASP
jgi:sigma-B regulation protein RsbQ